MSLAVQVFEPAGGHVAAGPNLDHPTDGLGSHNCFGTPHIIRFDAPSNLLGVNVPYLA